MKFIKYSKKPANSWAPSARKPRVMRVQYLVAREKVYLEFIISVDALEYAITRLYRDGIDEDYGYEDEDVEAMLNTICFPALMPIACAVVSLKKQALHVAKFFCRTYCGDSSFSLSVTFFPLSSRTESRAYDTSPFVAWIYVGRNYELSVELNVSFESLRSFTPQYYTPTVSPVGTGHEQKRHLHFCKCPEMCSVVRLENELCPILPLS